ncbi:MAG: type II toxin-antitoxin system prevent-host-death family antitoxin [Sciscionella sp.]|nr:type II toxin-antitoxin system prevent-host-death family antitoxin [Sciscionella sp.]
MAAVPEETPLAEAVAEVERTHGRVDIVRGETVVASVVDSDYLDSLEETIEIARDPAMVAAIAEGEADIAAGRVARWNDVKAELGLS